MCWQPFMRLKDKEELLLWTCFCTALSGEALSPIRFWADPLSHSQLSTHLFYLQSHKFRNESIWKSHLKGTGIILALLPSTRADMASLFPAEAHSYANTECLRKANPQKKLPTRALYEQSMVQKHSTPPGELCLLLALSLCTPSQLSSSSLPLNNLFLLAPMAYFPHYWKGIKPQVISSGAAFSHGGYYQVSYKRMIVCWYIHVLFCLWKCQGNKFRKRLTLIWITFQKVSILPKFPGLHTSQKLMFLAVFL